MESVVVSPASDPSADASLDIASSSIASHSDSPAAHEQDVDRPAVCSTLPPAIPSRPSLYPLPSSHGPPPKRTVPGPGPRRESWAEWAAKKGAVVGQTGLLVTDTIGGHLNTLTESVGSERWFPTTGDFPADLAKATRIFESFTVDGTTTATKGGVATLRKIPAQVIRDAKGIAIYSAMRNGLPPFGGSNGSGIVVARLKDGSWSAPSSVSPNQSTAGFMVGIDIFDAVLIIRTEEALLSFTSRAKFALGTDFSVVAGPYGAGAALDVSAIKAPILSYVRSRGLYAGIHLSGQVFVERTQENALLYCYPGVRASEILEGKVRIPAYAREHFTLLHQALYNAETGAAQRAKGGKSGEFERLVKEADVIELDDGERLRLPPTPEEIDEAEGLLKSASVAQPVSFWNRRPWGA
ncbi:SH3 domain-containing YSC84-like protein 1, partial [Phenoliferia sp. Uapishka_3]